MNKREFLKWAEVYIEAGFSIVPITTSGKMKNPPEGFRWTQFQSRRASLEEASQWCDTYGDLNIGIITGKISGLVVIDIDDRSILEEANDIELPMGTPIVCTGKGYHMYCKYPDGLVIKNSVSKIKDHIDIRGEGGLVVAPPSVHMSGRTYEWKDATMISASFLEPLPEWIIKTYYPNYNTKGNEKQASKSQGGSAVVSEGSRNDTMFRLAVSLKHKGLSKAAVMASMGVENLQRCNPPLEQWELDRIIESSFGYETKKRYNLTDLGNAERLKDSCEDTLRYHKKMGEWIVYSGGAWQPDEKGLAFKKAVEVIRSIPDDAEDDEERKELFSYSLKCESSGKLEAMSKVAKDIMLIDGDLLDANTYLLNLKNGTLNLKTMEFKEHSATDYLTKQGEVNYEPDTQCPEWNKFITRIFGGDEELIKYIQRAVGYSLTGETSEQVYFQLFGAGANGKSTFIDTIKKILGSYGMQTEFSTFLARANDSSVRNDIARLVGSRIVTASESGVGRTIDDTLLKQATGGDKLTARFLYREYFEYVPQFKIWLLTNHKPNVNDDSVGMWRRVRLIPFEVIIPEGERDKSLPKKLEAELPGILNWCLEGYMEWKAKGLGKCRAVDGATESYKHSMDTFGGFIDDCCITGNSFEIKSSDLYGAYAQWCDDNGERSLSQTKFSVKMQDRGYKKVSKRDGKYFIGLKSNKEF